jgi:hypothetical protein
LFDRAIVLRSKLPAQLLPSHFGLMPGVEHDGEERRRADERDDDP